MANAQIADRVRETTTTTGTGTLTLLGAVQGHRTFASAFTTGSVVYYTITDYTNWEVGYGTYTTSGTTLSRDYILSSSNSNAAINFGAGTKDVFNSAPTDLFNSFASQSVYSKSVAGNSNVTLSAREAGNGTLILTGVLTSPFIFVIVPNTGRWVVINNTTGGDFINITTAGGMGIPVDVGKSRLLVADGTNVIDPETGLASLYLGIGGNAFSATTAGSATVADRVDSGMVTVASAMFPDIFGAAGNTINYTGTTSCVYFAAAPKAGMSRTLICAGAAVFQCNANLTIRGITSGNSITLGAGARCEIVSTSTTTFDMTYSYSGSFTLTCSVGLTTTPAYTAFFNVTNGQVMLNTVFNAYRGTSNSITFQLSGIPASIRPHSQTVTSNIDVTNNGAASRGSLQIDSGTGYLILQVNGNGNGWTGSGTKSLDTTNFVYSLN